MADRRTEAAKERAAIGRQTTDELFNDEYAKAGIQPFSGGAPTTSGRRTPRTANQADFAEAQEQMLLQEALAAERAQQTQLLQQQAARQAEADDEDGGDGESTTSVAKTTGSGAVSTLANRTVFFWMMGWHWWQWTSLQLTIGGLSVMFLAIAYTLESTWIGRRINDVASFVNGVTSFVGFDFSGLSPLSLFSIFYTFLLGISWLSIFATIMIYKSMGNHPVLGQGSGLKMATLLIAFIGYAVPGGNLIPWIFFYIWVMLRFPK